MRLWQTILLTGLIGFATAADALTSGQYVTLFNGGFPPSWVAKLCPGSPTYCIDFAGSYAGVPTAYDGIAGITKPATTDLALTRAATETITNANGTQSVAASGAFALGTNGLQIHPLTNLVSYSAISNGSGLLTNWSFTQVSTPAAPTFVSNTANAGIKWRQVRSGSARAM